jgi:hypothetical protein
MQKKYLSYIKKINVREVLLLSNNPEQKLDNIYRVLVNNAKKAKFASEFITQETSEKIEFCFARLLFDRCKFNFSVFEKGFNKPDQKHKFKPLDMRYKNGSFYDGPNFIDDPTIQEVDMDLGW